MRHIRVKITCCLEKRKIMPYNGKYIRRVLLKFYTLIIFFQLSFLNSDLILNFFSSTTSYNFAISQVNDTFRLSKGSRLGT